jgi:hypothetical protein
MTKLSPPATKCRWCQRPFDAQQGPGRPAQYCKRSCRQRDYEARRRSAERGLDEREIIVTRAGLDQLRDQVWILRCAVQDVDNDIAAGGDPGVALAWLLDAARGVVTAVGE